MIRTPLQASAWLSDVARADVRLKLETQQPTSSFKIRGALNAVKRLTAAGAPTTQRLVTASAGNHGKALAWAARAAGLPLIVCAPKDAPRAKVEAIRDAGAELRLCHDYDAAERSAKELGARGEGLFISPYSHPDVIAGAGTIGLEILDDWPEVDVIVVPVGGGGLISGIAIAARALSPRTSVVGVEVDASCPFTKGLAAGRIVEIDVQPTLADGLAGNLDPDTSTFEIVRRDVSRIVTVSERELRDAMSGIVRREQLVAEGAAAVGVAALLSNTLDVHGQRVAVVLSGCNIDREVVATL